MVRDPRRGRRPADHVPGEEGIWVFIFGDLVVFGLFFVTYCYYRSGAVALYTASQHQLDQMLGLTNTILLLTSSWFIASALERARQGARHADRLILGGIACGAGFVVVKFFEYSAKVASGITLNSSEFYIFYYMYTGIHLLHVIIGLGVLTYLYSIARQSATSAGHIRILEGGAVFWHLVDVLWIILFALLYVAR